jgi:hypothetical protein
VRRQQFLAIFAGVFALACLGELALAAQDNQFADGICTGLRLASLPPDARALRLFHWVSRFDDDAPAAASAAAPGGALTTRGIVEHPVYYREDCGAKVWLLSTLAGRAGLKARELRLCDSAHNARHVVCELWVGGRWAVFDPMVELDFRRRDGLPATSQELRDPTLLAVNAARVPAYDLRRWQFQHPERLHFEKVPLIGGWLRRLAARLTGRPAEELPAPSILERPRLIAAYSFGLVAALALAALGWSIRGARGSESDRKSARRSARGLAFQSTDQD